MQTNAKGLARLSPREAEILRFIHTEAMPYKQIAVRLGITENTVHQRVGQVAVPLGLSRGLLRLWIAQRPECLDRQWVSRELHTPGCICGGPICRLTKPSIGELAA